MECIFCKIAKKEAESNIVYEDEKTIAFLDLNPRGLAHTLVIPKDHFENIFEIDEEVHSNIYKSVKKVCEKIKKAFNVNDFRIMQNNGKDAGQVVMHFHTHVIPILGYKGESLEEIAKKVREA